MLAKLANRPGESRKAPEVASLRAFAEEAHFFCIDLAALHFHFDSLLFRLPVESNGDDVGLSWSSHPAYAVLAPTRTTHTVSPRGNAHIGSASDRSSWWKDATGSSRALACFGRAPTDHPDHERHRSRALAAAAARAKRTERADNKEQNSQPGKFMVRRNCMHRRARLRIAPPTAHASGAHHAQPPEPRGPYFASLCTPGADRCRRRCRHRPSLQSGRLA